MRKSSLMVFIMVMVMIPMFVLSDYSESSSATTTSKETIKIGYLGTLSGPFAAVDKYETPAVQMVIDNVNAAGGLLGRKVELVTRDDQGDPSVVAQKLNELKAAGCVVVVGCILDTCTPALAQWAKDNKIPAVQVGSASVALRTTHFNKYTFNTYPISVALARIFARNISKQNVNSIYMIGADVSIAHDVYNYFWPEMKKIKPSVTDLGSTWVDITEMEFSNIISSTLAKNPNLLITGVAGPPWSNFIQQAKRFNLFDKTKVAGIFLLGGGTTEPFGGNYPNGLQGPTWCPYYLDEKPMKDFSQAFYKKTKLYPDDITMSWYLATLAAAESIKKADSTDPEKIVNALEIMTFDTPLGKVHYRDFDHQLILPVWYATSGYTKDYPQAIGLNPTKYGENVYPTKDEILSLRAAK
ncbi:MAG: ABC transporter substrate-binding protein [Thermodesulfobacteriota bacterium]